MNRQRNPLEMTRPYSFTASLVIAVACAQPSAGLDGCEQERASSPSSRASTDELPAEELFLSGTAIDGHICGGLSGCAGLNAEERELVQHYLELVGANVQEGQWDTWSMSFGPRLSGTDGATFISVSGGGWRRGHTTEGWPCHYFILQDTRLRHVVVVGTHEASATGSNHVIDSIQSCPWNTEMSGLISPSDVRLVHCEPLAPLAHQPTTQGTAAFAELVIGVLYGAKTLSPWDPPTGIPYIDGIRPPQSTETPRLAEGRVRADEQVLDYRFERRSRGRMRLETRERNVL